MAFSVPCLRFLQVRPRSESCVALCSHPDKNPDPESRKLFVKIANAYEILKDESTRGQYDYAIAHPEEVNLHSLV
jgi:DnaJ-class molecular chaperone